MVLDWNKKKAERRKDKTVKTQKNPTTPKQKTFFVALGKKSLLKCIKASGLHSGSNHVK